MNIFFVVIRNMKLFVMMRIKVNQNFFGLWWSKSFGSFDFWREDVCVCGNMYDQYVVCVSFC